ncbi:hypothetical protein [Longirhabdus pacifica]|uniref:hypothetical protein n=1 Tax=Longirhabdus pacifica TaxID=2305227 RepID=UPI0010088C8F|nr:hypothetical protein [Longirhabdus pacifica]
MYKYVELSNFVNNKGITTASSAKKSSFAFGGWYSLPREHFSKEMTLKEDIPFQFHLEENADNMELEGQSILVETSHYDTLYILGASNNGNFYESLSFFQDDKLCYTVPIYFPDLTSNIPIHHEKIAMTIPFMHNQFGDVHHSKAYLWLNTVSLEDCNRWNTIKFPDNPSIHIFAMTLKGGSSI